VLIGGDISDALNLQPHLALIDSVLTMPVYFVLGNHDYYHASFELVDRMVHWEAENSAHLRYLPAAGVVEITPDTALIGHGGWADGRYGDFVLSWVVLNDHVLIKELARLPKPELLRRLNARGDEAAAYIREVLPRALADHRRAILLTHVPPFQAACWHEGEISDDNFLPHFTCKAVGDALVEIMSAHADRELLVLCGHTHGEGEADIRDNLRVITGGAEYGELKVARMLEIM